MFEDFWDGYNYGRKPLPPKGQLQVQAQRPIGFVGPGQAPKQIAPQGMGQDRVRQQAVPGVYDKSKFVRMQGPNGESGEVYANGKMYIMAGGGKAQVRTFPSRPFGIKYMQQRGWVLV